MIIKPKAILGRSSNSNRTGNKPKTIREPEPRESLPAINPRSTAKKKTKVAAVKKSDNVMPAVVATKSILDIANELLLQPPSGEHNCGTVRLKFNHYNKLFPIHNGVLKWFDVDNEYAFSFVYRGNYSREISPCVVSVSGAVSGIEAPIRRDESSQFFLDLLSNGQYIVRVEEDPEAGIGAEGLRLNAGPLSIGRSPTFRAGQGASVVSGNNATRLLTQDLINISPDKLSSQEAKELIERRDIEDILFS